MIASVNKNRGIDWALVSSILFWIIVITFLISVISLGRTKIPHPVLEIADASATRGNLTIKHISGDPVRFANSRCVWLPDISRPAATEECGSLLMAGKEKKQGRVSKLEPSEMAVLEKNINMKAGNVGKLIIKDLKSSQQIFSQTVKITK